MKSIAIFCGSKAGNQAIFVHTAQCVGQVLAKKA